MAHVRQTSPSESISIHPESIMIHHWLADLVAPSMQPIHNRPEYAGFYISHLVLSPRHDGCCIVRARFTPEVPLT